MSLSSSSLSSLAGRLTPELEDGHPFLTTPHALSCIDSCAVQLDNYLDVSSSSGSTDVSVDDERDSPPPPSVVRNDEISFKPTGFPENLPPDVFPKYTTRELVNPGPKRPIISAPAQIWSGNHKVADLGKYIYDSFYSSGWTDPQAERRSIFAERPGHYKPQLHRDRENLILLYPGCFNPPHRGHQALLNRGFECCQDLNVIAAIILPIGPGGGGSKLFAEQVSLTKTQRARLWLGDEPHDWAWVFNGSDGLWDLFRYNLGGAAFRDGFRLDFIMLAGPDHVGIDYVSTNAWDCQHVVVSDVGREADFVGLGETLLRVHGCSSWRSLSSDNKILTQKATDTAMSLLSSLSLTMVANRELTP